MPAAARVLPSRRPDHRRRDRGFGSAADAADAAGVVYLAAEGLAAVAG